MRWKRRHGRWLAWLLWACGIMRGIPQDLGPVERHSVVWMGSEQGLPSGGASCMVQGPDGYLWFGTFDGIARFDGLGFKVFTPENTPEIPAAGVAGAFCDRDGRLWFSTYGGMVSHHQGQWTRHGPGDGWTSDMARTYGEAPDGTLYAAGADGKVLRRIRGRFEELPPLPLPSIGGLGHCDAAGRFWVLKTGFVGYWDGQAWCRVEVVLGDGYRFRPEELESLKISGGKARDGNLWILAGTELAKVDVSGVVLRAALNHGIQQPWGLHEDERGDLWIGSTRHGMYHVHLVPDPARKGMARGKVAQIRHLAGRDLRSVTFFAGDDEGNLWMGTDRDGIARWRPRVFEVVGGEQGLSRANGRGIAFDAAGRPWVATFDGGVFTSETGPGRAVRFRPVEPNKTTEAESIHVDRAGRVWATRHALGGPVLRLDEGVVRVVHAEGDSLMSRRILMEDAAGTLWVGGANALLSHQEGRWRSHDIDGISGMAQEPSDGTLWAVGRRGLYRGRAGAFAEVRDGDGASLVSLASVLPALDGGLWLGFANRGLAWRGRDGCVVRMGVSEGIPMRTVTVLHRDDHGRLWLGGEKGIACVPEAEALRVARGEASRVQARLFDTGDGLPANAHLLYAQAKGVGRSPDGRLWFPTSMGLVHVHPAALGQDSRTLRILPETMTYVDRSGRSEDLPWAFGDRVRLPPGTRSIEVGFAALAYAAPQHVVASTRLTRDGKVVSERVGPERFGRWDLLPPGGYAVEVAAANESGAWTRAPVPLSFVIEPFFWQTVPFRMGVVLAAAAVVVMFAGYRIRNVQLSARLALAERAREAAREAARSAEALRRSEDLRQQAEAEALWRRRREAVVRDVHDGIGGLASNLKMTLDLALHAPHPDSQRSLLQTMNGLVSQTLVEVHGLMDAMESEVATCGDMANEFRRHGNLMLAPHGVALAVRATSPEAALPKDPRFFSGVFRIYKEAIANVVKHARARRVEVTVEALPDQLRLIVGDDGVGLPANVRNGRGLSNMAKRAAELNGSLNLTQANGLLLTLRIPWSGAPGPCADTSQPDRFPTRLEPMDSGTLVA